MMTAEPTPRHCQCWLEDCVNSGFMAVCDTCNAGAEIKAFSVVIKVNLDDSKLPCSMFFHDISYQLLHVVAGEGHCLYVAI